MKPIFEKINIDGEKLCDLNVKPYWLSELPAFDDDPFWRGPVSQPESNALFISGPSRNGNHLLHSMLDGHPELCSVPGEDSFLAAFFQELLKNADDAVSNLRRTDNVEYILKLTGWGINKWKSLWELEQKGEGSGIWSGIQPDGKGYVTDYQDTVTEINYPAYKERLFQLASAIREAKTFVEIVWLYMDAMSRLTKGNEKKIYPKCWFGSGMRSEMAFLFPRTVRLHCIAPLRPFETFYFSFAKGRFKTEEVMKEIIEEAWQHWLHKTVDYLLLKKLYPERMVLVNFNNLITYTETTARKICSALKIPFCDSLLTATLLGKPTKGNSSFPKGEEVRGTFYTAGIHKTLEKKFWPEQYPSVWKIVEETAL